MTLLTDKKYEPLTEHSAIDLAIKLGIFAENSTLTCSEIGDGNLNLVFRITDTTSGQGIIIKQALPYAKVVGESWPLTLKRAKIEADALKIFGKLAPDYVPVVHFTDDQLAITVMDDLSHLTIARKGFIRGDQYPLLSKHLGEYLAKTLFYTSDFGMNQSKKKELLGQFINPELCKITEDLIFTDPYTDSPTNSYESELQATVDKIRNDQELIFQVALLKMSFLTEAEVLLHGDLHTGSVFASSTETKVIDSEFAFYGPAGFDIGQVFANLLFQALANVEKKSEILTHVETFWNEFVLHFSELWKTNNQEPHAAIPGLYESVLNKYFNDSLGFAGCELIRRTIGLAHVADLDSIEDNEQRINAKKQTLSLGSLLIKSRKEIKSFTDFLTLLTKSL
ncbi:S-methyl-5-thioribose kinase [Neobacillus sp. D3-1R]|uniref:S-methyl-5-thioribose kinase n=1 Tax=Neobacillus sp. D3-1R TaxID=3445778 RepID=UPI003FA00240